MKDEAIMIFFNSEECGRATILGHSCCCICYERRPCEFTSSFPPLEHLIERIETLCMIQLQSFFLHHKKTGATCLVSFEWVRSFLGKCFFISLPNGTILRRGNVLIKQFHLPRIVQKVFTLLYFFTERSVFDWKLDLCQTRCRFDKSVCH